MNHSYKNYTCFFGENICSFIGTGSKNCTNPEILYNDVVISPKEYIYRLKYRTFVPDWSPNYFSDSPVWTVTYGPKNYGKCFTPVLDSGKKGIQEILIHTKGDMRVFLHTPGVFHTQKQKKSFEVYFGTKAQYEVNYEMLKLLMFQNENYIDDPNHNKDKCTHDRVYKVC